MNISDIESDVSNNIVTIAISAYCINNNPT